MKSLILASGAAFLLTLVSGRVAIPVLRKLKAGQPIYHYVKTHSGKRGTPTMGGLFFVLPATLVFFAFGGAKSKVATVGAAIGLFYMLIGFLDDFIKIKFRHNEGLKPYQKIIFQMLIALLAGAFIFVNSLTQVFIPFTEKSFDLGVWAMPVAAVTFIAMTNSVNLTDGLDGLCGGVSFVYTLFLGLILYLQSRFSSPYLKSAEYDGLILLLVSSLGAIVGFLVFNVPKAKVFMGDTGSLALGGFLCAVTVFSGNLLFAPIIGIAFVWSSLSVIIQVAYFKRTKKRVFLMAPFHHHLQMKGFSETQIGFYYSLFTVIMGIISVIFYI